MRDIILNFPQQFEKGIQAAGGTTLAKTYKRIIACGMGGSQISAEILSMVRDDVVVHWDYDLPKNASKDDLVVCVSWSGNIEETISGYDSAISKDIDVVSITTGGELAKRARQNGTPLIILPDAGNTPRMFTGYMVGALFKLIGLEKELDLRLDPAGLEQEGKDIAAKICEKIPLLYSSYPWRRLTGFWKLHLGETAKRPAFSNWFPSAAHNEIVSFEGKQRDALIPIILRDRSKDPRYGRNFDALLAIFNKEEYNYIIVEFSESKPLEKIFNNYILAQWTSYALAVSFGINPAETRFLDEFKELKKRV